MSEIKLFTINSVNVIYKKPQVRTRAIKTLKRHQFFNTDIYQKVNLPSTDFCQFTGPWVENQRIAKRGTNN